VALESPFRSIEKPIDLQERYKHLLPKENDADASKANMANQTHFIELGEIISPYLRHPSPEDEE